MSAQGEKVCRGEKSLCTLTPDHLSQAELCYLAPAKPRAISATVEEHTLQSQQG